MMMANEFWHGSTGRGLAEGFRELGWDVAEIDIASFLAYAGINRFSRVAARIMKRNAVGEFNARILERAEQLDIEVLLTVKGSFITAETLRALRARGTYCVNFYPDVLFGHVGSSVDLLSLFDLVVTTKSYHLPYLADRIGEGRRAFVHHGYCPSAHSRRHLPADVTYRWDISHIGNPSPHKLDHLVALAEAFPDRSFAVMGNRWAAAAAGTALERHVTGAPVLGDYFARAIEQSRINLGIHYGPVGADGWEDLTSTRTFEIPAVGGFMLHVDNDEVRALYEPGREVVLFSGKAELIDKVGYYLEHEDERRAIAQAGHERCVPAYSLTTRAREIAGLLSVRRPRST
jgi:spore maturation protein CgeB